MVEIGQCTCGKWLTIIKGQLACPDCSSPSNKVKEALKEIKMYHIDPDHLGSITTIGIIEEILKEALV